MRVAEAMAVQAGARLGAIQFNIAQASIQSPFEGVIIEGNLRERIGTPVSKGENLFKISKGSDLYLEAEVSERDVHHLIESTTGELAFTGKPKQKFPLQVVRIEPAAISKDGENMFIVRCALTGEMEDWFRPGMGGVCKLEAGRRSLLWVFTHRTIDFLRLRLWM
jgi:multidrug efflux pump subunit AcrA (membrane-fusion protein)